MEYEVSRNGLTPMHRRAYLATLGSVASLALAGCSGPFSDDNPDFNGTELTSSESTTAAPATVGSETTIADGATTEARTETTRKPPATAGERTTITVRGETPSNRRYDRTRVTFVDENGTRLGVVRAWVADTTEKRYIGLSDTGSLPNGTAMLFTYHEVSQRTYVMREMDYPLDIVFIGADGRINAIESARAPSPGEDGSDIRRTGRGKYILEVPRGWMADHEIGVGDRTNLGEQRTSFMSSGPTAAQRR